MNDRIFFFGGREKGQKIAGGEERGSFCGQASVLEGGGLTYTGKRGKKETSRKRNLIGDGHGEDGVLYL